MTPPETSIQRLHRRAAELRAGQADAQLTGVADEIRQELAEQKAIIGSVFLLMEDTVAAAGIAPAEPERPRLRLIRGEAEAS